MKIRIGTRKSLLALAQTELVAESLRKVCPEIEIEIVRKETSGDRNLSAALLEFGGKGAFVSEFEEGLLEGRIDIAVHSGKDLPAEIAEGLEIAAVLPREDPRDVLIYRKNLSLSQTQIVVGTSSLRREIQIKKILDCQVKLLRGNVPSRLKKLLDSEYDAIILAAAGLKRLGIFDGSGIPSEEYSELKFDFLDFEKMVPAGAQGIIAVECRKNDSSVKSLLSKINHEKTFFEFKTERKILELLECGCHEPTAVFSEIDDGEINIRLLEKVGEGTRLSKISGDVKDCDALIKNLLSKRNEKSNVYLVGAGPGEPDFITVRGLEILKTAEILVYDNLANPLLLDFAPKDCEKIFVGKIPGRHTKTQEEINSLLVEKALSSSKRIVRLKGGDPFVFGRGGEEILSLEENGISYEVIPGITSAISALESAGIPVTHRKEARSFHVITGHTAQHTALDTQDNETERFKSYGKIEGTLVFLMGISNLEKICDSLIEGGKDPSTPVSIVESGTTIRERRTDGTLQSIVKIASERNVSNPAIIVVGECARHNFVSKLPLSKKKIAVTGTRQLVSKISDRLKNLGALVYEAPFIETKLKRESLSQIPDMKKISWLIFTSTNGVKFFFEFLKDSNIDFRALSHIKFCVVGNGTGDALREFGFIPDFVPEKEFTVEQMALEFTEKIIRQQNLDVYDEEKILILRAENGSKDLNRVFDENKIQYLDVPLYSTQKNDFFIDLLNQNLDVLDYMTFASSSGVKSFFETSDSSSVNPLNILSGNCCFVCIGRKTAETLEQFVSKDRIIFSEQCTADGIVEKLVEYANA